MHDDARFVSLIEATPTPPPRDQDAFAFLSAVLPPDESCAVTPKSPDEMSVKELKAAIRAGGLGARAVGLTEKSELVELLKSEQQA